MIETSSPRRSTSLGWLLIYDAGDEPGALERSSRASSSAASSATRRARRGRSSASARCSSPRETSSVPRRSRTSCSSAAGDPRTEHFAYHFLADCALIRGDTQEAETATARACERRCRSATSSRRASRCRASRWRPPGRGDADERCGWPARSRRCGVARGRSTSVSGMRSSSATSAWPVRSSERMPTPVWAKAAHSTSRKPSSSPSADDTSVSWRVAGRSHASGTVLRHRPLAGGRSAARAVGQSPTAATEARWPREESNLRTRIRSPSLYPLSYGARSARGGGRDLNPRPPGPQPGALPTELPPPRLMKDSFERGAQPCGERGR